MNPESSEEKFYTVSDICRELNASRGQIKRLLNNGLVRGVKYRKNGYRVIDAKQLDQLRTFYYLSRSGMKMKELKAYARLEYADKNTIPERKAILETKKRQMWEKLKDLQENIDFIERKIEIWEK